MAKYPEGNFTIVNNETGRALRVQLGRTRDASYHRVGTHYLQYVTEAPTLQLGEADNSPATVWWYSTSHEDSRQIVSYAVGEYQNIGDYCVWMSTNPGGNFVDVEAFRDRLNDMPVDVRSRLAPLIPTEWTALRARRRASDADTDEYKARERMRALGDAEQEAWMGEDNPPSAGDLAALHRYRSAVAEETAPFLGLLKDVMKRLKVEEVGQLLSLLAAEDADHLSEEQKDALLLLPEEMRKGMADIDWAVVERLDADPRTSKVIERTHELLPALLERRAAAALAAAPLDDLLRWHNACALRKANKSTSVIRFTDPDHITTEDRRITAALDAYLKAAAVEDLVLRVIVSGAPTRLYGCGASRGAGSTYGWTYDGTYIYGSDSKTVPSEQTYWTDEDGHLLGKPKGGPGQTWSIKPWAPSKSAEISRFDIALTGLFGPIGRALGL
ncbi:hypothetical protein ACIQZN_32135 [Streptomyces sp. NPDC097595]|uniref:hypothetical protein n=1 Tax=Streptomyces sp. NPDC097595 TaxID=3366090 RepID=UPI003804D3F7